MVVSQAKKRSGHPFTLGFVPMGRPPLRAVGFILGFVASEAVKWSEKDFVPSSTWQGKLFRQGWCDNLVSLRTSSGDLSGSVAAKQNLEAGIVEMWRTHPQVQVNNLLASFPRRLKAVVDLEGEYTK